MSGFLHFDLNTTGRDFVVGDIHGCFDQLRDALSAVNFDRTRDRLFSVGDLVDRGPSSHEAPEWLDQPWFVSVRGNHEQLTIEADAIGGEKERYLHIINGGAWFEDLPESERNRIGAALGHTPFAIEVETPAGLVGIVHAEVIGDDWPAFVEMVKEGLDYREEKVVLWARTRITLGDTTPIAGVYRVYVGHTIQPSWRVLGNIHYIDTGAFNGGPLTLVNLTEGDVLEQAA